MSIADRVALARLENFIVLSNPSHVDVDALRAEHAKALARVASSSAESAKKHIQTQTPTRATSPSESEFCFSGLKRTRTPAMHAGDVATVAVSTTKDGMNVTIAHDSKHDSLDSLPRSDRSDRPGSSDSVDHAQEQAGSTHAVVIPVFDLAAFALRKPSCSTIILGGRMSGKTVAWKALVHAWSAVIETAVLMSPIASIVPRAPSPCSIVPTAFVSDCDDEASLMKKVDWLQQNYARRACNSDSETAANPAIAPSQFKPVCFVFDDCQLRSADFKCGVVDMFQNPSNALSAIFTSQLFENVPVEMRAAADLVLLSTGCKGEKELFKRCDTWTPHCPRNLFVLISRKIQSMPGSFLVIDTDAARIGNQGPVSGMSVVNLADFIPFLEKETTADARAFAYNELSRRFAKHVNLPLLDPWEFTST